MRSTISLNTFPILILVVIGGCGQAVSQGGKNANENEARQSKQSSNPRNEILKQLQGQDPKEKLQTLARIVREGTDTALRRDALRYLVGLGADAQPVAEPLATQLLVEHEPSVVSELKQTLAEIEADVEAVLLAAQTTATDTQLLRIVETLGLTGASSPKTLELLQQEVNSENSQLAIAACGALEQLGPKAKSALPVLIAIAARPRIQLTDTNDDGRSFRDSRDRTYAAVRAMAALSVDESAIPVLTELLGMEAYIAEHAARALGDLGPAASPALATLKLLENRDDSGGKDVKTRSAREAATKAISDISGTNN